MDVGRQAESRNLCAFTLSTSLLAILSRITPVVNIVPMDWPVRDVFINRVATNLREG